MPSIHAAEEPCHNCLRALSPAPAIKSMQWSKSKAIFGALAVLTSASLSGQTPASAPPPANTPSPQSPVTTVTVTAYRTPLGALESPAPTRLLSRRALGTSPAVTLDGQVRQIPGIELFRRSSSLVANPSSQGVSLRGL